MIDGGFAKRETIDTLTKDDIRVFAPTMKPGKQRDSGKRQRKDSEAVAAWRDRMETREAKEIYKQRAATVETVNGDFKDHRGLDRLRVRGTDRADCVLLLTVLAYNLMQSFVIAPGLLA